MKQGISSRVMSAALALSLLSLSAWADGPQVRLSPLSPSNGPSFDATAFRSPEALPLRGRVSTIPKGTVMMIKLDQPISSFSNNLGDSISGTLENDVFVNDTLIVPAGSEVIGQVANVSRSGKLGRHGQIDVRFISLKTPDGVMIPIRSRLVTSDDTGILKGDTYTMDVAKGIGIAAGGTGVGAVLGTATGGLLGAAGAGAVFGTAVGGIAGIGYALMRQGRDVVLPSSSRVSIINDQAVAVNP